MHGTFLYNTFISIHALRGEGDNAPKSEREASRRISIHALRGEGDVDLCGAEIVGGISIHALRGEGDNALPTVDFNSIDISIHALRGEGDQERAMHQTTPTTISIHALRGEGDMLSFQLRTRNDDFNPRPPWGGRLVIMVKCVFAMLFQSTPSVGRATNGKDCNTYKKKFQSTPSVGRATCGFFFLFVW